MDEHTEKRISEMSKRLHVFDRETKPKIEERYGIQISRQGRGIYGWKA